MKRKNISKRLRYAQTSKIVFGDVVYNAGSSFGPRVQCDYQLVDIEEGSVQVDVDGEEMKINAGEVVLLLPGAKEQFVFTDDRKSRHTWCAVSSAMLSDELMAECHQAQRVLPVSRRFAQLIEMGLSIPDLAMSHSHGLVEALGMAVLQEYLFSWQRTHAHPADEPDAIRRAIEWVGADGSEPIDLHALAKLSGVSAAQLVKLFKLHLDTTPMRYVWETRTRRGAQLLRETGLTVSEIAYRSGFQTPFHFSRWVQQVHGMSPKEFRAMAWKQAPAKIP
jgi:AraC-like DNA-binding protein